MVLARTLLALTAILCGGAARAEPGGCLADGPATVRYHAIEGVDPGLHSLDIYGTQGSGRPVVVFVHGGGWRSGDKSSLGRNPRLVEHFTGRGMLLVAVNMRLWDAPRVTYKEQVADIAKALRWVRDHAAGYGGDPRRMVLFGYSSGAHLAALVATDGRYLAAEGLAPSILAAVVAMDVSAYDVPRAVATAAELGYPRSTRALPAVFSRDPEVQRDASPRAHVVPGRAYPPFLLIHAPIKDGVEQRLSKDQAESFAAALAAAGADATASGAPGLSHTDLAMGFGRPGHAPTAAVDAFLGRVLGAARYDRDLTAR